MGGGGWGASTLAAAVRRHGTAAEVVELGSDELPQPPEGSNLFYKEQPMKQASSARHI